MSTSAYYNRLRSSLGRVVVLAFSTALLFVAETNAQTSIPVTATVALCPEYKVGGVAVDYKYTVGAETLQRDPTIISQTVDVATNTATVTLTVPNTFAFNSINLVAYCRNARGTGAASAPATFSNCDALAFKDSDLDGLSNNQEDTNCDNFFSPGDVSNPNNIDTDGDGVRDLVEILAQRDPTNPGSSPRPYIFSGGPFDPDGDGSSNAVVWRPASGEWFIRDYGGAGNFVNFGFGASGDIPFTYNPQGYDSAVGVIRREGTSYRWLFHGVGFKRSTGGYVTDILFGNFGDNVVLGPWQTAGVTNPALARLFANEWTFYIYLSDGSVRIRKLGGDNDIPRPADYDGDGLFDIAIFRPSEGKTYVLRSSTSTLVTYTFGNGTADYFFRGDVTGDGIDDISFWDPPTGLFSTVRSESSFSPASKFDLFLGTYQVHVPLPWNQAQGKTLFTVIDHSTGMRYFRPSNNVAAPVSSYQWGVAGDSQG